MIRIHLRALLLFAILAVPALFAWPHSQAADLQKLANDERWQQIVALVERSNERSADDDYYYGLALARLQRWEAARRALNAGRRMSPRDKRFPIELAGVDFMQKKYARAVAHLRRALRLDPKDAYARDFLATCYFLQGNLEAALKYWNGSDKPRIEQVHPDDALRTSPILLDHAFAFSPASTLKLNQLLTSKARIEGLETFPMYRFELLALPDGNFRLDFHGQERNGFGNSALQRLLTLARGLPYQEIDPEYYNFRLRAINLVSLARWDSEKRRLSGAVSGPFPNQDPRWRWRLAADLRNENWDVRHSFSGVAPVLAGLNLRREAASAEITRFFGTHHSWSVGAEISHRDERGIVSGDALGPQLLSPGYELKQTARLDYELWRWPDHRLTLNSCASSAIARLWSSAPESFAKIQGCLGWRWLPKPEGDDLATTWKVRAGKTFGDLPFDELFMLGLERDNDLWLRAHIGTRGGRKGSAPLGRDYFLSNWETDKILYSNGVVTLKLSPFLDTGKINDRSPALGSHEWLWDTGVQFKLSVLGVGVDVSYGKDLRTGRNAIYTTLLK